MLPKFDVVPVNSTLRSGNKKLQNRSEKNVPGKCVGSLITEPLITAELGRALAVIKVTRIVSAASISMFFVRRIHFIYFLFFRVEFIFLGNNMHVTKTNLVTRGAWAYIWLKFWGTHGERRRWFGAEWCGLWEGMFPLKPTRGSVRGSVMSSFSGPKTDFCVF